MPPSAFRERSAKKTIGFARASGRRVRAARPGTLRNQADRRSAISFTDDALNANRAYAREFTLANLAKPPARKLAVLACMDARMSVERLLGLQTGDAHIIRNAGGIVTEDALRSLIISHQLLGTEEIMILNHTDCGMMGFQDHELAARLEKATGASPVVPSGFQAFTDLEQNVLRQIRRVKQHPWISARVSVRGFVYDVITGSLREVSAAGSDASHSSG